MYNPKMTYLKRNISQKINKLLDIFPAVVIIGPRQCGKTSLAKKLRPNWKYVDLESAETYDQVASDISFFFKVCVRVISIYLVHLRSGSFNDTLISFSRRKYGLPKDPSRPKKRQFGL